MEVHNLVGQFIAKILSTLYTTEVPKVTKTSAVSLEIQLLMFVEDALLIWRNKLVTACCYCF
jgi:hypothetical protein